MAKKVNVGLWGSCDPTTWRDDIAIPFLKKLGLTFYNPQIKNYIEAKAAIYANQEARASKGAEVHLFVIDPNTRALVSIGELIVAWLSGKTVIPVIQYLPYGIVIRGQELSKWEVNTLNSYRRDLKLKLQATGITVFDSLEAALPHIEMAREVPEGYRIRSLKHAAKVLNYDTSDTPVTINVTHEPAFAVQVIFDALISSFFSCGKVTVIVPNVEDWRDMQLPDGSTMTGRRYDDWTRPVRPYFEKFLKLGATELEIISE